MNLSPNFTLEELTASETAARNGLDNTPGPIAYQNLVRLANFLEEVKKVLGGKPVMINSAYRGPEVNAHVGGQKASQHLVGCAVESASLQHRLVVVGRISAYLMKKARHREAKRLS